MDVVVTGSPEQVRDRLDAGLLVVRSLWAPSPQELSDWNASDAPLYVRWFARPQYSLEIGPRVESMTAARFCPVLRGVLEPVDDQRTRLIAQLALPSPTLPILWAFAGVMVLWTGALARQLASGDAHAGWLIWYAILVVAPILGVVVGRVAGGPQLMERVPWLEAVVREESA